MGFKDFLKDFGKGIARANSSNLAGWVDGPMAHLKSGSRQVLIENGKLILFIVNEADYVIDKSMVSQVQCTAQNIKKQYGNQIMQCNSYAVNLKNGEWGNFTIFVGKATEFLMTVQ